MALAIRCFGKVQGVFYRASTQEKAQEVGISGWVINEPDGTVLIHAEGNQQDLKALVDWCHSGPQYARVDMVETWETPDEGLIGFTIRH